MPSLEEHKGYSNICPQCKVDITSFADKRSKSYILHSTLAISRILSCMFSHHYTINLTFVCDVTSVRAGGHGKPFDPS